MLSDEATVGDRRGHPRFVADSVQIGSFAGFGTYFRLRLAKEPHFKLRVEAMIQQRARMSRLWAKMLVPTADWKCCHPLL